MATPTPAAVVTVPLTLPPMGITAAVFVNANVTAGVAPFAEADTAYVPAVLLPLAVVLAVPLPLRVAAAVPSAADAPPLGAANVTTPPATGSTGFFAVTVTANGAANADPATADCPLPLLTASVNPPLSNAPMSGVLGSVLPRWSVVMVAATPKGPLGVLNAAPAAMAGLAGQQRDCRGAPARSCPARPAAD